MPNQTTPAVEVTAARKELDYVRSSHVHERASAQHAHGESGRCAEDHEPWPCTATVLLAVLGAVVEECDALAHDARQAHPFEPRFNRKQALARVRRVALGERA